MAILIVQAVVFALFSVAVATENNRDPVQWGLIGFFFGVLGFIAVVAVGEKEAGPDEGGADSDAQEFDPDQRDKKCPDCAEYIKLEAQVCRYCGCEFPAETVEKQVEKEKARFEAKKAKNSAEGKDSGEEELTVSEVKRDGAVLLALIVIIGGVLLFTMVIG